MANKKSKPKARLTGNSVQQTIDQQDMCQQELSDLTGIEKALISRICSNKRPNVSVVTAIRIAAVLKVPVEELFSIS